MQAFYQKLKIVAALVVVAGLLIASRNAFRAEGHSYHYGRTFFLKTHTTNLTTVQMDTFNIPIGGVKADTLWAIAGTGKDTSRALPTYPYMSFRYAFEDTSSDDSVGIRLVMYMGSRNDSLQAKNGSDPPPYGQSYTANHWAPVDSVTITSSGAKWWIVTDGPVPNAPWFYIVATGTSTNNIVGGSVVGTVVAELWDNEKLR